MAACSYFCCRWRLSAASFHSSAVEVFPILGSGVSGWTTWISLRWSSRIWKKGARGRSAGSLSFVSKRDGEEADFDGLDLVRAVPEVDLVPPPRQRNVQLLEFAPNDGCKRRGQSLFSQVQCSCNHACESHGLTVLCHVQPRRLFVRNVSEHDPPLLLDRRRVGEKVVHDNVRELETCEQQNAEEKDGSVTPQGGIRGKDIPGPTFGLRNGHDQTGSVSKLLLEGSLGGFGPDEHALLSTKLDLGVALGAREELRVRCRGRA